MLVMAEKKKPKRDAHRAMQVPFRVDDPQLIEALDAYAAGQRRSRNMAIVLLLEEGLERAGFWPPGREQ